MPKDSAAAEHRNGLPTAESLIEQSTETNVKLELGDLLAASHGEKSSLKKGGASSKAGASKKKTGASKKKRSVPAESATGTNYGFWGLVGGCSGPNLLKFYSVEKSILYLG